MSAPISAGKKAGSRFANLVKDNGYVTLAFFATAILMLFIWFCFQAIPFGSVPKEFAGGGLLEQFRHGRTMLRMDAFHQYGPLFGEYYERLTQGRSLLYSWNTGLGGNFLGNFFNYLSSPFGLLVLVFGHARVPEAFGVMILLKAAFASGTFAYMLRKMFNRNDASIAAFGVLYTFCGFFIAYYWNVMWIDAMALLPLVALGIDYVVKKQRFTLFAVSLAVTLVSNYYMGFMVCIFSVLFFLLRYFGTYDFSAPLSETQKEGKKSLLDSRLLRSGAAFVLGSALAGALAAFALLPVFYALRSSSATSGEFPDQKEWFNSAFSIFDFLANHLADVTPTIRSSGDDVLPNIYCGAATLLLLPLYFFVPSIKTREKVLNAALLALLFFSFNTRVLNYIWHANHFPNDLPYRFSFLYSFLLVLIAFRTFQHLKELSGKLILGSGLGMTLFVIAVQEIGSKNVNGNGRAGDEADLAIYLNIAFFVAYAVIFFAHRRTPQNKTAALSLLLLCAVVTEVCAADTNNFEITQEKYPFVYDLASFQKAKARLTEKDKSFHRMELTDLRTRMDPAWYDYPGVSTFSSMAYEKTSNLEYRLGLGGNFINSYTYNPQTPVYNAMHSLKYLFETQGSDDVLRTYKKYPYSGSSYVQALNSPYYTYRFTEQRFTVFENNYWLPIGYFANDTLRKWATTTNPNPFELQADYWKLASGQADVFLPLNYFAASEDFDVNVPSVTVAGQYVSYSGASAMKAGGRRIQLDIYVEKEQNAYIQVNSSSVSAVSVLRSDRTEERSHDDRCIWDLGVVTPDAPLRVELQLDSSAPDSGGFSCYVYALNEEAFLKGYEFFKDHSWQIAENGHSDTMLTGTITAPPGKDGLLYTSIPYDTGWQVTVDGKRVNVKNYVAVGDGAFLAVPLKAGMKHTVTFRFIPLGLRSGVMISGAALILLGLWGFLLELRKRKNTDNPSPAGAEDTPAIPAIEYAPSGRFPIDYPSEAVAPPKESGRMFATEGLRPEDFSLTGPAGEPEERFHLTLPDPEALAAEAEQAAPSAQEEDAPQPDETPTEDAPLDSEDGEGSPQGKDVASFLQKLQADAAALEARVSPKSDEEEPPNFQLS